MAKIYLTNISDSQRQEVKTHLERNGYDVAWKSDNVIIIDSEETAYVLIILCDREIAFNVDFTEKKEAVTPFTSSEELVAGIQLFAEEKEKAAIIAKNRRKSEIKRLCTKISKEYGLRIAELIKVANACIDNGISIDRYHRSGFCRAYDSYENGTFVTNGITHRLGFVKNNNQRITCIGIEAGGYCGEWDIQVMEDGIVREYDETFNSSREPDNLKWVKRVYDEFETFEKAFYNYLVDILGGTKA